MFEVDLRTQIPKYGTINADWGGPACCQMAMNGYPPGATSCYVDQTTIWNYIQANNKEGGTGPWGIGWYSDPYAITKALNDLCPPEHHWIDVSDTEKEDVLYKLFVWMANYKYASLLCVHLHDLWRTVVYYRTSDDPRIVTNPTLERIGFYVPYLSYWTGEPEVDYEELDGSAWMTGLYYWGLPCGGFDDGLCGQIWNNKYVGVGEPPVEEGSVQVEIVPRVGKKLVGPREATHSARRFLNERRRERSEFLKGRLRGLRPAQPILVREMPFERRRKSTDGNARYYLIPFVQRYEIDRSGARLARLSVLVNAYSGRFEQLSVFSRPVRYLSQKEAIRIARRNLRLSRTEVREMEVEPVFSPLRPHVSSALPVWKIAIGDRRLFVSQSGLIFGTLVYRNYRGA